MTDRAIREPPGGIMRKGMMQQWNPHMMQLHPWWHHAPNQGVEGQCSPSDGISGRRPPTIRRASAHTPLAGDQGDLKQSPPARTLCAIRGFVQRCFELGTRTGTPP